MRIAIVQFPGSNCERETSLAVKRAGMEPFEFLWNAPLSLLQEADGFVIVGGFSYEDRSRAGIIAALDPVMQVIREQSELGKPILGICNGAQILVETGLVPGVEGNKVSMVLAENKRVQHGKVLGTGYYNAWVHLTLPDNYQRNAFTRHLKKRDVMRVPVAHGEGRFVMGDGLYQEMVEQGQNCFLYCDEQGEVIDAFPVNPNGSRGNIAGISNKAGNVLALMPHPERVATGDVIFTSMRDYIAEGLHDVKSIAPLHYYPRSLPLTKYKAKENALSCLVSLIITDNEAVTIENTLNQLHIPVQVKRAIHYEMHLAPNVDKAQVFAKIRASGELYNDRKEMVHHHEAYFGDAKRNTLSYLVVPKEDMLGEEKKQVLEKVHGIRGILALRRSTVFQFTSEKNNIADLAPMILATHIIANPYAHDCYQYEE